LDESRAASRQYFISLVLITITLIAAASYIPTRELARTPSANVKMDLMPALPLAASDVGANYSLLVATPNATSTKVDLRASAPIGLLVVILPSQYSTNGGAAQVTVSIRSLSTLPPGEYPFNITMTSSAGYTQRTFHVQVVRYLVVTEVARPSYDPANLTVPVGSTVYWIRLNGIFSYYDPGFHSVTFYTIKANSPDLVNQYQSWNFTFDQTGSFRYHCEWHVYMYGIIDVG
jgi:plastocyanin